MKIPRKRRSRKLIPRFDLQGFHVNKNSSIDPNTGIVTEGQVVLSPFNISMCTLHPTTGSDLNVLPEGLRSNTIYTLITDTDLTTNVEGTDIEGDIVRIPMNKDLTEYKTFWVVRVGNAYNNVIPSTKAICVEYQPDYGIGLDLNNNYSVNISGNVTSHSGGDESWWDYWEVI